MPKRTTLGGLEIEESEPLSIINIPIDWQKWNLAKQSKAIRLLQDKAGNIIAIPVFNVDPLTNPMPISGQRTPTVFKGLAGANGAGLATIWTPAKGKKFRLLGGNVTLTKEAACAGALWISLCDNTETAATRIIRFEISSAALVATGQVENFPFVIPGNGYLSQAADNVLALNLSGALTAGLCTVSIWGVEE